MEKWQMQRKFEERLQKREQIERSGMFVDEAMYLGDQEFSDRLASRAPQQPAQPPRGDVGYLDHALPPLARRGAKGGPAGKQTGINFGEVLEEASVIARDFLAGM